MPWAEEKLLQEIRTPSDVQVGTATLAAAGQATIIPAPPAGKALVIRSLDFGISNTSAAARQINTREGAAGTQRFFVFVAASSIANISKSFGTYELPVATALILEAAASFTGLAACCCTYRIVDA